MSNEMIVLPMMAMVLLTLTVMILLLRRRIAAVKAGEIELKYYKTYQGDTEPDVVKQATRHYINLFETPVMFYAACLVALTTGVASPVLQALAWVYVAVRVAHAYIHLGTNRIIYRMRAYGLSLLLILLIWILLVVSVLRNV